MNPYRNGSMHKVDGVVVGSLFTIKDKNAVYECIDIRFSSDLKWEYAYFDSDLDMQMWVTARHVKPYTILDVIFSE